MSGSAVEADRFLDFFRCPTELLDECADGFAGEIAAEDDDRLGAAVDEIGLTEAPARVDGDHLRTLAFPRERKQADGLILLVVLDSLEMLLERLSDLTLTIFGNVQELAVSIDKEVDSIGEHLCARERVLHTELVLKVLGRFPDLVEPHLVGSTQSTEDVDLDHVGERGALALGVGWPNDRSESFGSPRASEEPCSDGRRGEVERTGDLGRAVCGNVAGISFGTPAHLLNLALSDRHPQDLGLRGDYV